MNPILKNLSIVLAPFLVAAVSANPSFENCQTVLKNHSQTVSVPSQVSGKSLGVIGSVTEPDFVTPEIQELARGLQNDKGRIFDFVANKIESELYYGCKKGAHLTLLEGGGNDTDKACLLAALMRASGFTANYWHGWIDVPYQAADDWDLMHLLKLDANPFSGMTQAEFEGSGHCPVEIKEHFLSSSISDANWKRMTLALSALSRAGYQVVKDVEDSSSQSRAVVEPLADGSGLRLKRVSIVVDGFLYDPWVQRYDSQVGTDVLSWAGYNHADVMASLGGSYLGSNQDGYGATLGTGLDAKLTTYTQSFLAQLRSQLPNADVEGFLGQWKRRPRVNPFVYPSPQATDWLQQQIPPYHRSLFQIGLRSWLPDPSNPGSSKWTWKYHSFWVSELRGDRLSVVFDGDDAVLLREGTEVMRYPLKSGDGFVKVLTRLWHPTGKNGGTLGISSLQKYVDYARDDDRKYKHVILYSFSPERGSLQAREDKLDDYMEEVRRRFPTAVSNDNIDYSKITDVILRRNLELEILNVQGHKWNYQRELSDQIFAALNRTHAIPWHAIGRMSQTNSYFIDVYQGRGSQMSLSGSREEELKYFYTSTTFASALEHAVIEQSSEDALGVSTVKVIRGVLNTNNKHLNPRWNGSSQLFQAHLLEDGNRASKGVRKHSFYGGAWFNELDASKQAEYRGKVEEQNSARLIYPIYSNAGFIQKGLWNAYALYSPQSVSMIVGGANGGYSRSLSGASYLNINPFKHYRSNFAPRKTRVIGNSFRRVSPTFARSRRFGADPVDVATGAFLYSADYLSMGEGDAPMGLNLKASYNSRRHRHDQTKIGNGWTHNWDIRAVKHSRPEALLGRTTVEQMAPFLVAAAVANEVMSPDSLDIKDFLVPVFCADWAAERTIRTCRTVIMGEESVDFIEILPNTFVAPGNTTMTLTKQGNDLYCKQRQGNQIRFNSSGKAYRIYDPYLNNYCSITYSGDQISQVTTSANGYYLNFNYSGTGDSRKLTSVNDSAGRDIVFSRTDQNLMSIADPEDKLLRFSYTDNGMDAKESLVTGMADHSQRTIVENVYDPFQRVKEQKSEGDAAKLYTFFYTNYCNIERDPSGAQKLYCYDNRGRLVSEEDAMGTIKILEYDGSDHKISETILSQTEFVAWDSANPHASSFQKRVEYDFPDDTHNLNHQSIWLKAGEAPRTTTYEYDSAAFEYRPLSVINPLSQKVTYVYKSGNSTANPDEVIDHANKKTLYKYAPSGINKWKIEEVTDRDGYVTKTQYGTSGSGKGKVYRVYPPSDGSIFSEYQSYDSVGNLTKMKDARGVFEYYDYDDNRQRILLERGTQSKGNAANVKREWTFDDEGNLFQEVVHTGRNGESYTLTRTWSPTGKPLKTYFQDEAGTTALADDAYEENTYDLVDRLFEAYDVKRFKTTHVYYPDGQLAQELIPADSRTGTERLGYLTYDVLGRKKDSYQMAGLYSFNDQQAVIFTPTALSRKTTISRAFDQGRTLALGGGVHLDEETTTDPMDFTVTRSLDRAGNLRALTNRRDETFEMDYDHENRVKNIRTPEGHTVTHNYTDEGRLDSIVEASTQLFDHSYYPVGHLNAGLPSSVNYSGTTVTFDSYDSKGNLLQASEAGKSIARTYDEHDRVKTYTNDQGYTMGYTYYRDGLLKELIYPKGTTDHDPFDETNDADFLIVTYDYYRNGRLKTVTDWESRVTQFFWHGDGRLDYLIRPNQTQRKLSYDSLARLSGITERNGSGSLLQTYQLGYKPSDEIDHRFLWPRNESNQTFHALSGGTHDGDNSIVNMNGESFTYDADGNLTDGFFSDPAVMETAVWDTRNRLTGIGSTTYDYDLEGHRIEMTQGSQTTAYLMDPHSGPFSRVLMRQVGGKTVRYIWGMGLMYEVEESAGSGGGGPPPSGVAHYYHYDNTGSTTAVSNQAGAVVDRMHYAPYGQLLYREGSFDTPFLFSGYLGIQTDPNGLLNMRARYYSPVLRRFISSDPQRFKGGLNFYAYAAGNPIAWADPSGFGPQSVIGSIQTGLTALGMLPGVGFVFDLVNAGISAVRGDALGVATNLASAVPGIGQGVAAAKLAGGAAGLYGGYRLARAGSKSLSQKGYSFSGNMYSGLPVPSKSGRAWGTHGQLKKWGATDSHHIIQHASAKRIPGYSRSGAPAVQLNGPSTRLGSEHYLATQVQRQRGSVTYASERRIGYKALRRGGLSRSQARFHIKRADEYFVGELGVTPQTVMREVRNRR